MLDFPGTSMLSAGNLAIMMMFSTLGNLRLWCYFKKSCVSPSILKADSIRAIARISLNLLICCQKNPLVVLNWGSLWQFFLKSVWAVETIQVLSCLRIIISHFASKPPTPLYLSSCLLLLKAFIRLSICYTRMLYWFNSPIFKADIAFYFIRVVHKEPVRITAPLSQAVEKMRQGLLLPWRHHSLNRWERIEEIDTNT